MPRFELDIRQLAVKDAVIRLSGREVLIGSPVDPDIQLQSGNGTPVTLCAKADIDNFILALQAAKKLWA